MSKDGKIQIACASQATTIERNQNAKDYYFNAQPLITLLVNFHYKLQHNFIRTKVNNMFNAKLCFKSIQKHKSCI